MIRLFILTLLVALVTIAANRWSSVLTSLAVTGAVFGVWARADRRPW